MKTVSLFLVMLIFLPMNIFGQERDRQPVVSGTFYPAGSERLRSELAGYFASFGNPRGGVNVRAILVPHAGYVYSGHTAAAGFAAIPAGATYDNIFLIGVSHRYAFEGAAVFTSGNLVTPLGKLKVNSELGRKLQSTNRWFISKDEAHGPEHSLEVQLPFIQYRFNPVPQVVPVLIGTRNLNVLRAVATGLEPWFNDRNLFIISSDFSHYPSAEDARRADRTVSDAIVKGDPEAFLRTIRTIESAGIENLATAMCGWPAGLVLMYLAEKGDGLTFRNVEYTNSGDLPGGSTDQVVGYNAIVLEGKALQRSAKDAASSAAVPAAGTNDRNLIDTEAFSLTEAEQKTLFAIAREAITARLEHRKPSVPEMTRLTPRLMQPLGAFVTITMDGDLRGCIGRFTSPEPLWEVVGTMATEAAFSDPRFPALTKTEYPSAHLEISVLGPMRKVQSVREIKVGKHGIYLKNGYRSGTLLPQVAVERGWTADQFLGYCARDKAGIGWDGWKDPDTEIFVYEAYVFGE
jgi:AmmeMemoRadiSam system protein B/AmmeMemoRadiSam system protein A